MTYSPNTDALDMRISPLLSIPSHNITPKRAIEEFFYWFHLPDAQKVVWEMFRAAISSDAYEESSDRMHLVYFVERISLLLESLNSYHEKGQTIQSSKTSD